MTRTKKLKGSKMILLNGPAGCGKNSALEYIYRHIPKYVFQEALTKEHLYTLTIKFFNVSEDFFWEVYYNRELKKKSLPEFAVTNWAAAKLGVYLDKEELKYATPTGMTNLTIREAMIYVSELVAKPAFGNDYFGKCRASILEDGYTYIDDSCGFVEELPPLFEVMDQENIMLIRIFGRGDFEGDSRGYIPDGVIENTYNVHNTESESFYNSRMLELFTDFLNLDLDRMRGYS